MFQEEHQPLPQAVDRIVCAFMDASEGATLAEERAAIARLLAYLLGKFSVAERAAATEQILEQAVVLSRGREV